MSQILRNYTEMPVFAKVKPEDIENLKEKYHGYLGINFEADTVKKVRITTKDKRKNKGKGTEEEIERVVYVVPLVDHKSSVEYDVAMQLFYYMAVIWKDYADHHEKGHINKGFRYPLIIPIVYYEGKAEWTADLNFMDRIEHIAGLKKYIPKFEYKVIACHKYSNEVLRQKHDEMSLIMLLNKIQTAEDLHKFTETPQEYVKEILGETTEDIRKIISDIFWTLMMKLKIPLPEAQKALENLEAREVGRLFENIEEMDIQAERDKTLAEKNRADAAENRANAEKNRADAAENRADAEKDRADAAENRADAEKDRADAAENRADAEKDRADAAENRADAEKDRADAAENRADTAENYIKTILSNVIQEKKRNGHTKAEVLRILEEDYKVEKETATTLVEEIW